LLEATEFDQGLAARFCRIHAGPEIVLDVQLEMGFHLRGELAIAVISTREFA
jgi:hypothetical protein